MIKPFLGLEPKIHPSCFIAENASIIGDVRIDEMSSVLFGSVLRADLNYISIGKNTNIQDLSVLHIMHDAPCIVGNNVVVGHSVNLHGCTIGDGSLIGIGAIVLSYAEIGKGCIIGAGSLIPEGKVIPDGSLVVGSPGRIIRKLSSEEQKMIIDNANVYSDLVKKYLS